MSIKEKYPIKDWILTTKELKEGDWVVYEDEFQREIVAQFVGVPEGVNSGVMVVQPENSDIVDIISYYDTIIYKLHTKNNKSYCSCGAKFTSNPKFHLKYCSIQ